MPLLPLLCVCLFPVWFLGRSLEHFHDPVSCSSIAYSRTRTYWKCSKNRKQKTHTTEARQAIFIQNLFILLAPRIYPFCPHTNPFISTVALHCAHLPIELGVCYDVSSHVAKRAETCKSHNTYKFRDIFHA